VSRFFAVLTLLAALTLPGVAGAEIERRGITFGFWTDRPKALPLVDDLGANTYRDWLFWHDLEGLGHARFAHNQTPTSGSCAGWPDCQTVLTRLDSMVAEAHSRGITPVFFVLSTPRGWEMAECSSVLQPPDKGSKCPPADPATYGSFVYNLARRYADRGTPIGIEVWNEADDERWFYDFPDSPMPSYCAAGTVNRTACEYSRLVKASAWTLAQNGYADTTLVAGALALVWYDWPRTSEWISDLGRNGALQVADALSYHYYAPTTNNTAATYMAVDSAINKIRPKLHFMGLDSLELWLDEISRHPTEENMLDNADDADFYRQLLPALDAATYNGQPALQAVMPTQLMDDEAPGVCPWPPLPLPAPERNAWCNAGMYFDTAANEIKPGGAVVKFIYTSWGS
jgi:hypothetical protein